MRLNKEGLNPPNENIQFYGNIWSDPTGTMGATSPTGSNDFSDTPIGETASFVLDGNLYWNGGAALPYDAGELINTTDDAHALVADPLIPDGSAVILPRWVPGLGEFADGSHSIREAFVRLAALYGTPPGGSPAIDAAMPANAPAEDILGRSRAGTGDPDMGAFERMHMLFLPLIAR
jgi:hypothetical protein